MSNITVIRTDILVAGGGMAGVCCALAAARCGTKVVLCHNRPSLGGNASNEVRMHVVGADCSGGRGAALETEAREGGIIEEIRLENAVHNPQRSASVFDLILYDKCRNEPNLTLMLNNSVVNFKMSDNRIEHAISENRSTENNFKIEADIFIDCTGDGGPGVSAGARFREGRESSSEYSESLAPGKADLKRLGSTLMFHAERHEKPMPFVAPTWARKFTEEDLRLRSHADIVAADDAGLEYGYWWVEWGGALDTIGDNEEIRDELLAIIMGVWDHVKNGGEHGAENWALDWFGFLPGKRESRRFTGLYTLDQNDIMHSTPFDDAIAFGGWPIDVHPVEGVEAVNEEPCTQHKVPVLYDIPLRSCISGNISNLMFAGRNISATHIAFASTRVMATAAVIGQGVGTAAAFATHAHIIPSEIPDNRDLVNSIQQRLIRDDAFLIGITNNDSADLARISRITASTQLPNGKAENVVSGCTRSTHGKRGVTEGRTIQGTHRWMSSPSEPLPQWIQLSWNEVTNIGRIELVFDTGMHRILTLSHSNEYSAKMQWGMAQRETVHSYRIEYKTGSTWKQIITVRNNFERKRVHRLSENIITNDIRIVVLETYGEKSARIVEIRVYRD